MKCNSTGMLFIIRRMQKMLSSNKKSTWAVALASILGVCFSNYFTWESNTRAEKLFGAQIQPAVQSKPVDFRVEMHAALQSSFGTTTLSIINYTNFNAYNVKTDVKYHDGEWVREWLQAYDNDCKKRISERQMDEESQECKDYASYLKDNIGNLCVEKKENSRKCKKNEPAATSSMPKATGEILVADYTKSDSILTQVWKGEWTSKCDPCTKKEGCIVAVRTMWENEKYWQDETIDYYSLTCTRVAKSESYAFIPVKLSLERRVKLGQ